MYKERIKSFILILLIVNSVYLTMLMWFDNESWSREAFLDALKDTPVIEKIFSVFDKKTEEYAGQQLYDKTMKPRRVVLNGGGAREVYLKESTMYTEAMRYVDDIFTEINSREVAVDTITYEEWKNLFKTKSLYVDFGYSLDSENLGKMYGMSGKSGKLSRAENFSGVIIVPDVSTDICTVCMFDEEKSSVTRISFFADVDKLYDFIEQSTYQKQQNDTFAFEINLDILTTAEDEVERQVAFSPMTLLTIPVENESNAILQNREIFSNNKDFEEFAERTLNIFGYTGSSLRKIVKNDGTIIYVENNATVTFYMDGTIEYSAVSEENGLRLSNGGTTSRQAVHDTLSIAGMIWEASGIAAKNLDYHLVSQLTDNDRGSYTVRIDNMYKGTTINFKNVTNNAVLAQVDEGYITHLAVHLSDISETGSSTDVAPVLVAIDSVYESYGKSNIIIEDAYKCYDFDEAGKGTAKWVFKISGEENNLVVDTKDLIIWNGAE